MKLCAYISQRSGAYDEPEPVGPEDLVTQHGFDDGDDEKSAELSNARFPWLKNLHVNDPGTVFLLPTALISHIVKFMGDSARFHLRRTNRLFYAAFYEQRISPQDHESEFTSTQRFNPLR